MSSRVYSISKTDLRDLVDFQNRSSNIKILKFTQTETIMLILKNAIFNGSSFTTFETTIGFVVSKKF